MESHDRVHLLDPLVAQRIAAGEVIERPASVVRELIDNAVDAKASSITVQLVEGGLQRITVIDDGDGIHPSDLPLCCRSHATSKVEKLEDLYNLSTLGFRGEALYSVAACAKVTIASSFKGAEAAPIVVDNTLENEVRPGGPRIGSRIDVENLFSSIPARRLFLKRPSTESTMCKGTLVEKALAYPHIAFRFYDGDQLKLDFPITTPKQRILDALASDKHVIPSETTELFDEGGHFSLYAVATTPACYRTDRSHIKIYINTRPVEDYALVQAITYGYGEMLPGGAFPYCYLFITVDPELVDFNIHPAKREAKLRNQAEIHHQIVLMVKQQISKSICRLSLERTPTSYEQLEFGSRSAHTTSTTEQPSNTSTGNRTQVASALRQDTPSDPAWFTRAKELLSKKVPESQNIPQPSPNVSEGTSWSGLKTNSFKYVGQAFDLFLIVERNDTLYLIDQHAAHERILFDQIRSHGDIQRLMIPLEFEVGRDVDAFLIQHAAWYSDYGLELSRIGDLLWELATIPALWKTIEKDVVAFISSQAGNIEELEKKLYATIACHAAIKDGDSIDSYTAEAIIQKVLAMENPVCPHGRTFVVEVTKESLWQAVGRLM
ncbi:MAG: DNA mismatch repair protein MutL [Spirochaetae bacterium HGW-Spirochaetae-8]|nr:MAG: DNA mismatch repair protein MutL [Spirochaetae bacterium HGW-Spirochaetae-8]